MTIPTFDLSRAPPGRMTMPYGAGGGIEGGRSLSGIDSAIDMTGGPVIRVKYTDIQLGNIDPKQHLYWSQLGGILNPRVRSIIVPLLTDFTSPGPIAATLAAPAALNAGTLQITVAGMYPTDRGLIGGEWFEIVNPTRLNRVHVITDIDAEVGSQGLPNGTATFTVGISPPLREAATQGQALNFWRPKCIMRLAPGQMVTSDVEQWWWTTPEIDLIESWGTT